MPALVSASIWRAPASFETVTRRRGFDDAARGPSVIARRTRFVGPETDAPLSGTTRSSLAPWSARDTICRIAGASSFASVVAKTRRAPREGPSRRSISSSGQPRGVPDGSSTWRSGRATDERGPADPCSSGSSLSFVRRSVSDHVVLPAGNAASSREKPAIAAGAVSTVFQPVVAGVAIGSAGPMRSWCANTVCRGPRAHVPVLA